MTAGRVRKPNYTPTARYFNTTRPVVQRYFDQPVPLRRPPGGPMIRLSCGAMTAKEDMSFDELQTRICRGKLNARFLFPDTGFVTTRLPASFWQVVAGRHLAFTEMTVGELSGWAANPLGNAYLVPWLPRKMQEALGQAVGPDALFRTATALAPVGLELVPTTVAVAHPTPFRSHGYDHYVNLLSLRKRAGCEGFRELQQKLGREPDESELKQHLHHRYGPVVAPIAFKGREASGKKNFTADEELVVTAVFTAVATAQETLILTRDTDVFEQFCQLVTTLSADYAAFRYAEVRHANPDGCPLFPMDVPLGQGQTYGIASDRVEHVMLPQTEMDRLWPQRHTPVHVFCVLVGNTWLDPKVSVAGFCLEREMEWLLAVKGRTGGKNTEHFPGRNMIVGASNQDARILFLLTEQTWVNYEGVRVTWYDLHHALKSDHPIIAALNRLNFSGC